MSDTPDPISSTEERTPDDSEIQPLASEFVVPRPATPTGVRLGALFEVLLCSDFPTQLFIGQVLALFGLRPFTSDHFYSATFIVTLSLADAGLLVGLVFAFLHLHGERPRDVLFGRRPVWREAVLGVFLIPVVFVVAVIVLATVQQLAPSLHNIPHNPLESLIRTPASAVVFALVAVVSGGIREEVQRAFILHRFEQHLGGAPLGLAIFSVVFGAGHVIQGWDAAVTTTALGALWGILYLARRSIAAPMVSHAGFDLVEIVGFAVQGR